MSRDGSTPSSPIKPNGFDNASGTVTRSNPPFPLFIDDGQAPPEAYGVTSYTTRPPWMTDNASVSDISGVTKNYVVDGATFSPFETSNRVVPEPTAAVDRVPVNPPAEEPAPVTYAPVPSAGFVGMGALIKLFVLGVKLLPLIGVLLGGYYTYAYYFGPIPLVNRILHPGAAPAAPVKPKAVQVMDMTRDVVARNNSRVDFANELATEGFSLDKSDGLLAGKAPTPAKSSRERASSGVRSHAVGILTDRFERIPGPDESVTIVTINRSAIPLAGTAKPSEVFMNWVRHIDVTGVRSGDSPRALIDGVARRLNDTVDFGLMIRWVGIDETKQILLFRDATGAVVGKDYY